MLNITDSDGTRNRDYSVQVIVVVSLILFTLVLMGVFATAVENERYENAYLPF